MKMRFENANEMREKVPVGATFRVYCTTLKDWSAEQHKFVPTEDKHPRRGLLEDEKTVFIFNHKSHRYGQRLSIEYFIANFMIDYVPVDKAVAWERRVKNVIKKLDASGLWPDIKKLFEELLIIGYARRDALKHVTCDHDNDNLRDLMTDVVNKRAGAIEKYNAAFERVYKEFMDEIPFVFYKSKTGVWNVRTDYFFEMSDAVTKSMYFGKYRNARIKDEIRQAFAERRRYSARARTSYDVSFEYDPERNKAWYSEEYKDCGNGHYYIAIDANTALFCEDD